MRRLVLAAALLALTLPATAQTDRGALASRVVTQFLTPAYDQLSRAADDHARAWEAHCAGTPQAGVVPTFRALADAWSRTGFFRDGPMGKAGRAARSTFWPARRNAVARGLAPLLKDEAAPTPQSVRQASAAAQGLPALERLLFEDGGAAALAEPAGARRCLVGRLIAGNLADIAAAARAETASLAQATAADPEKSRELLARVVTDALAELEAERDLRLAQGLGEDAAGARPQAFEGWRAGRAQASLVEPLAGIERLVAALADGASGASNLTAALATAREVAAGLPEDFARRLGDPNVRTRLTLLKAALRGAQDIAQADLPALAGVTVGFNSRDGD